MSRASSYCARVALRRGNVLAALLFAAVGSLAATAPRVEPIRQVPAGWPLALRPAFHDIVDAGVPAFRRFGSRDGLPQNAVLALDTEPSGVVWAGTKDGAATYDGKSWHVVGMPEGVDSNVIRDILATEDGDVWFATDGGGVARRVADGSWRAYGRPDGLPSTRIRALARTGDGAAATYWAGTEAGLARFDGRQWLPVDVPAEIRDRGCTAIIDFDDGGANTGIWASFDGIPALLRDGAWTLERNGLSDDGNGTNIGAFIVTRAVDGTPQLVAGHSGGVSVRRGDRWDPISVLPGLSNFAAGFFNVTDVVETVAADGSLSLWIAATGGVFRYAAGRWVRFGPDQGFPQKPLCLLVTGTGPESRAVWIGTNGLGLHRLSLGLWSAFRDERSRDPFSIYSIATHVRPDGSEVAWLGTVSSGLVRIESGRRTSMLADTRFVRSWIRCIAVDDADEDSLWLGCGLGSLLRVRHGSVREVLALERGQTSNVNDLAWSTVPDGVRRLWVATDRGLWWVEGEQVRQPAGLPDFGEPHTNCLLETADAAGRKILWLGTASGLVRYDGTVWTKWAREDGLPDSAVLCLREIGLPDGSRELWIGTRQGLGRLPLDESGGAMAVLSTSSTPALPNNTVYRIEADRAGRIYVTTNKGVARLTPSASGGGFGIYVFSSADGLPDDECNTGASTVDPLGRVWVGTLAGAAVLDPGREPQTRAAYPLRLTRTSVVPEGGRPLVPGEAVPYGANHVVFEFAMVSHHREESTQYRTQLVGRDETPSDWSSEARREYISLPAGSYTLRVWGRDAFGVETGPVSIAFSIRPAMWLSWWALVLYALLLAGFVAVTVHVRHRTLRRRNDLLEQAIADRTAELARSVDELSRSRREALESEHRAKEANLAKSVFLANMSHELRTPLNAVLGFSQLLDRSTALGSTERHQLSVIRRSGEHLLGLINDVLSIAKIEAGRLELHVHAFDISEMLSGVEAMTRHRAEAKDLLLAFDVDEGFPPVVLGDDGKLRQVLLNLLGNAVKFTDRGTVRLNARWERNRAWFEVSDTGHGIDAHELDSIFEAFTQTRSGRSTQEGTGLGLTISRQIARMMGGDLRVTSHVGAGTTFVLDISLPATTEALPETESHRVVALAPDERRRRVLVVDDNTENRLLLSALLTAVGLEVREARHGREAIEIAAEWSPRVTFMDQRMPVMDGAAATRELRRREARSGRTRSVIITTTASVFEQDREEIIRNGSDDLVTKPFSEREIFDAMARHAGFRFVVDDGSGHARPAGGSVSDREVAHLLSAIPGRTRQELADALRTGDALGAERIAGVLAGSHPELHAELVRRLRAFELEALQDAVESGD